MNTIDNISKDKFREIRLKRIPTLIKNGLSYFPNLEKWNKEYIVEKYGDIDCTYSYHARPVRSKSKTNYRNFFNKYNKETYTFTRKIYNINDEKGKIISDINYPNPFFDRVNIDRYIFYSGPKHTGALPHSHGPALNLMKYGRKRWIFFDTFYQDGKKLEQYYYNKYPLNVSWLEWYNKEYNSMDKFVKTVECIQEPNDLVFIPDNFNHTVFNEEETMGIVVELL